jgi:hypothetical protein
MYRTTAKIIVRAGRRKREKKTGKLSIAYSPADTPR